MLPNSVSFQSHRPCSWLIGNMDFFEMQGLRGGCFWHWHINVLANLHNFKKEQEHQHYWPKYPKVFEWGQLLIMNPGTKIQQWSNAFERTLAHFRLHMTSSTIAHLVSIWIFCHKTLAARSWPFLLYSGQFSVDRQHILSYSCVCQWELKGIDCKINLFAFVHRVT